LILLRFVLLAAAAAKSHPALAANSTLVFVVDILGTVPAAPTQ